MKQKPALISVREQVQIVETFLSIAEKLKTENSGEQLKQLSVVATLLEPHVDQTEVTLFFDLGEYLYECGTDIDEPAGALTNGWREKVYRELRRSLEIAKNL